MSYPPLRQQRLADVITERLEAMMLEGSLKPGQRLPPERELAERFWRLAPLVTGGHPEISRPRLTNQPPGRRYFC